jgi:hypothetical protein
MSENPFSNPFASYSNNELFRILQAKEAYPELAVEAARKELVSRDLPPALWRQLLLAGQVPEEKAANGNIKNRMKNLGSALSPFNKSGVDKDLALIQLSISFLLLYVFIFSYDQLFTLLVHFSFSSPTCLLLLPYFLIPVGIYFFRRRLATGWIILCSWISYTFTYLLIFLVNTVLVRHVQPDTEGGLDRTSLILCSFIFGSLLYALNRKHVREALHIKPIVQYLSIVMGLGLGLFLYFSGS